MAKAQTSKILRLEKRIKGYIAKREERVNDITDVVILAVEAKRAVNADPLLLPYTTAAGALYRHLRAFDFPPDKFILACYSLEELWTG